MSAAPSAARDSDGPLFTVKTVLALILVGVFSLCAFVTLNAYAPDLDSGDDGRAHALSRSAVGFQGLVELARARGEIVTLARTKRPLGGPRLVILTPEKALSAADIRARARSDVLIILPKWETAPSTTHPGWVSRVGLAPPAEIASVIANLVPKAELAQALASGPADIRFVGAAQGERDSESEGGGETRSARIEHLQTLSGEGLLPIAVARDDAVVLAQLAHQSAPRLYILADPDLLNNQGVGDRATARAALAVLDAVRAPREPLVFDVTLNGFERARSLFTLAFEPPFAAASLCLAIVAVLLGWRSITRARPAAHGARAIPLGKRVLAENSAALMRLVGREHKLGWEYGQLIGAQITQRLSLARTDRADALAILDRLGAARAVSKRFSELVSDAAAARTNQEMVNAAQRLYAWREEMGRAFE